LQSGEASTTTLRTEKSIGITHYIQTIWLLIPFLLQGICTTHMVSTAYALALDFINLESLFHQREQWGAMALIFFQTLSLSDES